MEDMVDAHNASMEQIRSLTAQLHQCEAKLMDLEDRSRRSNIRLQGIPEESSPGRPIQLRAWLFQMLSSQDPHGYAAIGPPA
ncbi:Hypothetical predicted protein [Pelobates cultripes]|uniref:Uncharacterized protein n=1 Tax=Pelobates cultripes TaxID=61616 RepID=A0AAD1WPC4_PELCU|nr:Hypothetical predicted protein [Pelobates cultripes]